MKQDNLSYIKTKSRLSAEVNESITRKTDLALVDLGYSQAYTGLLASLFCATIILISLYHMPLHEVVVVWYGFVIAQTLLRWFIVSLHEKGKHQEKDLQLWRSLFIFGACLGGIVWGSTGFIFLPHINPQQQTLLLLVLAGTTAGAVPVFTPVLSAAVIFITTIALPVIIILSVAGSNFLFDSTVIVYFFFLLALSKKTHMTLRYALGLQFENNALLVNLSEAKNELEKINKKLEQAATHDPLTNVANRNLFITIFDQAIENAKHNKNILALMYIDLDNFKNVNDIHGHHVGDQLLLVLTDRLEHVVNSPDEVARLGGDEFTIIREDINNPKEIAAFAKRVCEIIAEPIIINELELRITASIGIGVYPIDGNDAEKLLNVADRAMYHVKERGGNNFRFNVTLLAE
jgi:diguanylate cyclase (GGDEF)-like protein